MIVTYPYEIQGQRKYFCGIVHRVQDTNIILHSNRQYLTIHTYCGNIENAMKSACPVPPGMVSTPFRFLFRLIRVPLRPQVPTLLHDTTPGSHSHISAVS